MKSKFVQVPPYIRDVMARVSHEYGSSAGNYARLALDLLDAKEPHEVLFATLNYDTILEQNLTQLDSSVYQFKSLDHYVTSHRAAKVVKLHGSCDWFKSLRDPMTEQPGSDYAWDEMVGEMDLEVAMAINRVKVVPDVLKQGTRQIRPMIRNQHGRKVNVPVYPILTPPLADKDAEGFVCPPNHIQAFADFAFDCEKFLVIGTSGNEPKLMELLANSTNRAKVIDYVAYGGDQVNSVRDKFESSVQHFDLELPSYTHKKGFGDYLVSDRWQRFISI